MKYLILLFLFISLNGFAQVDTTEQIYQVVEEMPTLKSCDSIENYSERKNCSDKALMVYIYSNFKMPKVNEGMFSTCEKHIVSFTVEKDGSISNFEIIRYCKEFEEEIKRLYSNLPPFTAGKQNGVPVRVKYLFPCRFHFE